jgi:hypothetical protein
MFCVYLEQLNIFQESCYDNCLFSVGVHFEFTGWEGEELIHLDQNGSKFRTLNPLNAELNPTCHLMALLGTHHILHISRIKVDKLVNFLFH